jgi:hypothetical protein
MRNQLQNVIDYVIVIIIKKNANRTDRMNISSVSRNIKSASELQNANEFMKLYHKFYRIESMYREFRELA